MADPFEGARFAGVLLAGSGLAGVLLVGPSAFVSPAIWNGPEDVALRLIARHRLIWRTANVGFALATVMTAAGLFMLPGEVGERGASLGLAAAVAFALAGTLWLMTLSIRLAVTPGVASGFVADGTVDPVFPPLARLGGATYVAFIFIGGAAMVALGAAILIGGSIAAFVGWASVAIGLLIVGGYLMFGDMLPAIVYFPTTIVGIALLLTTG
jgi:hypothetical protein